MKTVTLLLVALAMICSGIAATLFYFQGDMQKAIYNVLLAILWQLVRIELVIEAKK